MKPAFVRLSRTNLEIISTEKIGNYDPSMLYHADVINDNIWIALTNFSNTNEVRVLNSQGYEIDSYNVGSTPGDFTNWEMCYFDGDVNQDEALNVFDVVSIVDNAIYSFPYGCESDLNADGYINILDVTTTVQLILN